MRVRITHATAATVYRWATTGKRRRRRKWLHCLAVCRVLNRREAPLMARIDGVYGLVGSVKLSWGYGHVRDCGEPQGNGVDGTLREVARACAGEHATVGPPWWDDTESARVLRKGSQ